jgi:hypothetical protein
MKIKLPLIVLCLMWLSCTKEVKVDVHPNSTQNGGTVSLKRAISMMNSNINNGLMGVQTFQPTTTDIQMVGTGLNNCIQNTSNVAGAIFATHGNTYWYQYYNTPDKWYALLSTTNNNGSVLGSGIGVRYPFKQGTIYTINIVLTNRAVEVTGDAVSSLTRRPALQAQLTNNAPFSPSCNTPAAPVTLVAPGPVATVQMSQSNDQENTRSISFSPTECYDYLRLSALPNMTGVSEGRVIISKITIIASAGLEVVGPDVIDDSTQSTYSVEYSGFNINEQFNWTVTGDLQIIGLNTGPTVVVKANGINGGRIEVGLNGCQNIAAKNANVCGIPLAPNMPTANPNGKTQMLITIPASPGVVTGYKIYLNGTYLKSITTSYTSITVPCGVSKTLGIEAYNSCGISSRTNKTIVGCEIDPQ